MPQAESAQRPRAAHRRRLPWLLLVPVLAFAIGLLAFAALWFGQRDAAGGPDTLAPALPARTEGRALPAPPVAGDGADPGALPVEPLPASPPPIPSADIAAPRDRPHPDAPRTVAGVDPAAVAVADSPPLPLEAPPPRFPREALRRGESGEVLLRVRVGRDGVPAQVSVARGSGSRALDRAATDAVRRWRFRPALQGGAEVEAEVQVPIRFEPG